MVHPMGEAHQTPLRVNFDRRLKLEFHGSNISSDAGLLSYRELDDALGLSEQGGVVLSETRRGKNTRHLLVERLRRSVFARLAGCAIIGGDWEEPSGKSRLNLDAVCKSNTGLQANRDARTAETTQSQKSNYKYRRITGMTSSGEIKDVEVLNTLISALKKLDREDQERIIQTVATFFNIEGWGERPGKAQSVQTSTHVQTKTPPVGYSEDLTPTPKEFLLEKQPRTDVERIAVLAYYLTHYRDMPHFNTLDLSKLNTEAAQPKFANTAYTGNNAQKMKYLVSATKGQRQLSAGGEQFVQALPDRELAKKAMTKFRPRRKTKQKEKKT